MKKWDIHMHTTFSDGINSVREMFEFAHKEGIDGIVITDHDTMDGWKLAEKASKEFGVETLPGAEITTPFGDVLAIGIEEVPDGSLEGIIESIHSQGGVAIAAHPFGGYWETQFTELPDIVSLFDAWEMLNGGVSKEGNEKAVEYGLKNGLVGTAGSDAHFKSDIGSCFIEIAGDPVDAVKKGRVMIGTRLDDLSDLAGKWNAYAGGNNGTE